MNKDEILNSLYDLKRAIDNATDTIHNFNALIRSEVAKQNTDKVIVYEFNNCISVLNRYIQKQSSGIICKLVENIDKDNND